jgi:tRNA A-37 threonylcarbamoyl transferase component Bud32
MGDVYLARDRERESTVAVKVLKQATPSALSLFKREFRAVSDVNHPNLVSLYELTRDDDHWLFTMEYVNGVDFVQHVAGTDADSAASSESEPITLSTARIARLHSSLQQLVRGVMALHEIGMLHRDIKPQNVLVTPRGRVVLLDFGLVTDRVAPGESSRDLSFLAGTAPYMAPEQGTDRAGTPASDWYSVGVMLFEALTSQLPFSGEPMKVLIDKRNQDAPDVCDYASGIPEDLGQLCAALLVRDPKERPDGLQILQCLGVDTDRVSSQDDRLTPLVGRDDDLEQLQAALGRVKSGHPVISIVNGPSGIGKSLLIQHTVERMRADGSTLVLAGRCHERESVAYKALDPIIEELTWHLLENPMDGGLPDGFAELACVFPGLGRLTKTGLATDPMDVVDHDLRNRAVIGLGNVLTRLAQRSPTVIVVDDVQWADVDSASLLVELLQRPEPPGVHFVLGCRRNPGDPSLVPDVLCQLAQASNSAIEVESMTLQALSRETAMNLAQMLLDRAGQSHTNAEQIARESAGHPLLLTQLVLAGEVKVSPETASGHYGRLVRMLQSHIDTLGSETRCLLEVICLAGRPLEQNVALDAAGLGDRAFHALSVLRAQRLVRTEGSRAMDKVDVYHSSVRDTVCALLSPSAQRAHSHSLAIALEAHTWAGAEPLMDYFLAAGDEKKAGHYAIVAAGNAGQTLAFDRAARLYRRAFELSGNADTDIQIKLAHALANAGRGPEAAVEFRSAADTATGDDAVDLRLLSAGQLILSGHTDAGLEEQGAVCEVIGLPPASNYKRGWLAGLPRWLWLCATRFRYRLSDKPASASVRRRVDRAWRVAAGQVHAIGRFAGPAYVFHLWLALRSQDPYCICRALITEAGRCHVQRGRMRRRGRRLLEEMRQLAADLQSPHLDALLAFEDGCDAVIRGQFDEGLRLLSSAENPAARDPVNVKWQKPYTAFLTAATLLEMGRLTELSTRTLDLCQSADERGDRLTAGVFGGFYRLLLHLFADDLESAVAQLDGVRGRTFYYQLYFETQANAWVNLYGGHSQKGLQQIREVWPELKHTELLKHTLVHIEMLELRARAALAAAMDDKDPNALIASARRDAQTLHSFGFSWVSSRALLIEAAVAMLQGDRTGAARMLSRAIVTLREGGQCLRIAVVQWQCSKITSGTESHDLRERASEYFTAEGIASPERFSNALLPGFEQE